MHRVRMLAAAAMIIVATFDPSAMAAASTLEQPTSLHLVRADGFSGHVGGSRGGHFARGGWGYRRWGHDYRTRVYPYGYGCPYPYPYSYAYCTFPDL
jgi:hypothetical protein